MNSVAREKAPQASSGTKMKPLIRSLLLVAENVPGEQQPTAMSPM